MPSAALILKTIKNFINSVSSFILEVIDSLLDVILSFIQIICKKTIELITLFNQLGKATMPSWRTNLSFLCFLLLSLKLVSLDSFHLIFDKNQVSISKFLLDEVNLIIIDSSQLLLECIKEISKYQQNMVTLAELTEENSEYKKILKELNTQLFNNNLTIHQQKSEILLLQNQILRLEDDLRNSNKTIQDLS